MSALYRKYPPRRFEEVQGQEFVIKVLKSLVKNSDSHHSIILSGIHGVGKTLLAKIFSKSINCIEETGQPCLKCKNCLEIEQGAMDIMEIDGATYTGIDNIRKIIDDAKYLPISLKYKVYIIDEAHRLSRNAFDSLLKILENPPNRVKFIFATTDIAGIPDTILSRCLSLSLSRIPKIVLLKYLGWVCNQEKTKIDDLVLDVIATEADGSAREALSILQIIILSELTDKEEIFKHLKIFSRKNVLDILVKILKGLPKDSIEIWQTMQIDGYNEKNFFHKLSEIISNLFLIKSHIYNVENKKEYEQILKEYNITYSTLVAFWEIIISQTEALYAGCDFTVETTITMMSHIEEGSGLIKEASKLFPNLKII